MRVHSHPYARRLKTWRRSRMGHERFSNLVVTLNGFKLRTDSVSIADVAQEFFSSNEDRKRNFGTADNFKVAILGRFIQHIGYTGYYNT